MLVLTAPIVAIGRAGTPSLLSEPVEPEVVRFEIPVPAGRRKGYLVCPPRRRATAGWR